MNTSASYQLSEEWCELFRMETGTSNRLLFSYQDFYTHLSFGFQDSNSYYELDCDLNTTMQNRLGDGNVHHLIATYDVASGYKAVWVDGAELGHTTSSGWNTGSSSTVAFIGNNC
jgi:hypothetical protein